MGRFSQIAVMIHDLELGVALHAMIAALKPGSEKVNKDNKKTQTPQGAVRGVINTITGGFTCGGCMKSARNVTFEHSKLQGEKALLGEELSENHPHAPS
ncbi:hypothetical protein JHK82_055753 [Glycine max]|nr:hypothetical protein JHK85_056579 [Glycine max]KAG5074381.1 hypothetical protein JHK84_055612 [Glycine max]KAG5077058.1 hypothetical protein JHK82_055753 [Glycine max]